MFGDIVERNDVLPGNNQQVYRRHWIDIAESNHPVVCINYITGYLPCNNFTKNTIHLVTSF